jgi:small conductance mechanosensitive channel
MRFAPRLALFLALALPAAAQTVAIHQAATPAPATPTPAKATAAAIIPGSPLAALTGAAAPPDADANTPAPFGTDSIGLSLTRVMGDDAAKTFDEFSSAVQQSTRLTPVLDWLESFPATPGRRDHLLEIGQALLITIVPGLALEAGIRFALARTRENVARRAVPRDLPPTSPDEDDMDAGLADAEAGETERRPRRDSLLAWGRRLLLGLAHFGLALLPLLGFAELVQILISVGVLTSRPAHLAIIGIVNGYLFNRLVMEIMRFLFAPGRPSLRLIAASDHQASWLVGKVRLLLATAFFGFAFVSIAEILGLAHDGGLVLFHLLGLVLHLEVAVAIWQSRHIVGRWIAGHGDADGKVLVFRKRLGQIWYVPALFYVLALWIALAAGVQHAFALLLRVILVVAVAGFLGRLAWNGSTTLLARAFPDQNDATARHPKLAARARTYNPLIRGLIRAIIGALVIVLILQGWGLNAFGWLLTDPLSRSLIGACISVIVTIAAALIVWELINASLSGRIERLAAAGRSRQASRLRTLVPMLKAAIGGVLILAAGFICLAKIGVNTAPLLAISGVVGIAVGFGSQKLVQDIITGLFLLLEDAMQVGDVITLAGMTGTVERLSIRSIRLRGGDGSVNLIPFSAVTTVTNMTRDFGYAQISIEVSYEEDLPHVYDVLRDISHKMRAEPAWGAMMRDDIQIFGLDQFGASALVITGQIRTGPGQHWAVRREFNARVKQRFEADGIEMPYTYLPPAPPRALPDAGEGESKQDQEALPPGSRQRPQATDPMT